MADKKLVCPICGTKFDGCRTCHQHDIASWKTITDTENHFIIFVILHKYNVLKSITKEQAKKELLECDVTGYESFPKSIKASIEDILGKKEEPKQEIKQETKQIANTVQNNQYRKNTKK